MNKKDFLIFGLLLLINSFPAYAYLDAGAGSMIIQGFIGSLTVGYFFIKNFLGNFFKRFTLKKTSIIIMKK